MFRSVLKLKASVWLDASTLIVLYSSEQTERGAVGLCDGVATAVLRRGGRRKVKQNKTKSYGIQNDPTSTVNGTQ